MMKFVINGKASTSNGRTLSWKTLNVLCEYVESNLMINELKYGLENNCSRKKTQKTTDKYVNETGALRKTTTSDDKLKNLVVKLVPMFNESVFSETNRADNVGASQLHNQASIFDNIGLILR